MFYFRFSFNDSRPSKASIRYRAPQEQEQYGAGDGADNGSSKSAPGVLTWAAGGGESTSSDGGRYNLPNFEVCAVWYDGQRRRMEAAGGLGANISMVVKHM